MPQAESRVHISLRWLRWVFVSGVAAATACSSSHTTSSGPSAGEPHGSSGGPGANTSAGATPLSLPRVTPPVRAAAPQGLGGTGARANAGSARHANRPLDPSGPGLDADGGAETATGLSAADIKSRFFSQGPTDIYSILGAIDDEISGLEMSAEAMQPACLGMDPIAYTITPVGQTVTLYAQCYESLGSSSAGDPGFIEFGQKDGTTYYYSAIGQSWTAAVLTPAGGAPDASADASGAADSGSSTDGGDVPTYRVQAWSGVGYLNAATCGNRSGYDDCSYGVIDLLADPSTQSFEISVAGIGFGYCGAQLKSDGASVFGTGSADMGSTCGAPETLCVAASDVTTPAACDASVMSFTLPALGRQSAVGPNAGGPGVDAGPDAAWAASAYPGGTSNQVVLDGTSSDSLHFGPTSPTPDAGAL